MSLYFEIYRFDIPTKEELAQLKEFKKYESVRIRKNEDDKYDYGFEDEYRFKMYDCNDKYIQNLVGSKFLTKLTLPQETTDYSRMYSDLGFSKEDIAKNIVHLGSLCHGIWTISNGTTTKKISSTDMHEKYSIYEDKECYVIKMKLIYDSSEGHTHYHYIDQNKVLEYFPGLYDKYFYVEASNELLAKAEVPFLIFERNKGYCFIYAVD